MNGVPSFRKLGRGFLDQTTLAALNFLIIALLSWLTAPESFSTFVLLHSFSTGVYLACQALWITPLVTFYSGRYSQERGRYSKAVRGAMLWTSFVLTPLVVAGIWIIGAPRPLLSALMAVLVGATWALYDLERRILYAEDRVKTSAIANVLVLCTFAGAASVGSRIHESPLSQLAWLWVAYSVGLLVIRRSFMPSKSSSGGPSVASVLAAHWRMARWGIAGIAGYWLANGGLLVLVGMIGTADEVGGFRVARNLVSLAGLGLLVYENMMAPVTASTLHNGGWHAGVTQMRSSYRGLILPFIGMTLAAGLVCWLLFPVIVQPDYLDSRETLPLLVAALFVQGLGRPITLLLRSQEETKYLFFAHSASAVAALSIGAMLVPELGEQGAAIAVFASSTSFVTLLLLGFAHERRLARSVPDPVATPQGLP